jgi:phosphoribosylaminoimidazolecarboxamide formyltransferase/IMP cyclohydrolase
MVLEPKKPIALISVYDKTEIDIFAQGLVDLGWQIISSGGTAAMLRKAGIPVTDVGEVSGLDPILDHRVATLVPEIHGGLLATVAMLEELERLGYPWIDLCCGDFYPLQDAIDAADSTWDSVIKATDIGGPTLIRSAVKGDRIVLADPADRADVLKWIEAGQPNKEMIVRQLAAKGEHIVAEYIRVSANYRLAKAFPQQVELTASGGIHPSWFKVAFS